MHKNDKKKNNNNNVGVCGKQQIKKKTPDYLHKMWGYYKIMQKKKKQPLLPF